MRRYITTIACLAAIVAVVAMAPSVEAQRMVRMGDYTEFVTDSLIPGGNTSTFIIAPGGAVQNSAGYFVLATSYTVSLECSTGYTSADSMGSLTASWTVDGNGNAYQMQSPGVADSNLIKPVGISTGFNRAMGVALTAGDSMRCDISNPMATGIRVSAGTTARGLLR